MSRDWFRNIQNQTILAWVITRVVILCVILLTQNPMITHDPSYYSSHFESHQPLMEYPFAAEEYLHIIFRLGGASTFNIVFVTVILILDFLILLMCFKARNDIAAIFWTLNGLFLGLLIYARFDLLPAFLVAATLFFIYQNRQKAAAAALAFGVAFKIWPMYFAYTLVRDRKSKNSLNAVFSFIIISLILAILTILIKDFGRLLSPFGAQTKRGLQAESIWGSSLLFLNIFIPRWHVSHPKEIVTDDVVGPFTSALTHISNVLILLPWVLVLVLAIYFFCRPVDKIRQLIGPSSLLVVLFVVLSNKVLSTQYIIWIVVPATLVIAFNKGRETRIITVLLTIASVLTSLYFPLHYEAYTLGHTIPTIIVFARNLVLIVTTIIVLKWNISIIKKLERIDA
ncbi:MAG: hypothetical protein Q3962_09000 [Corynebacterium sp.]|nr:hypothetical protein [Corynebacterium sp.]